MTFMKFLFSTLRSDVIKKSVSNPMGKHWRFSRLLHNNGQLEDIIIRNTVICRENLTPELVLRLITPECELWHAKHNDSEFPNDPFWGIYWPGGQALSR